MPELELHPVAQQWAHDILLWVGFGTLVGLLAKAIMPGRDPGGPVATVLMGIVGSVIGCGALMFFTAGARVTPLSPLGFVVATAGAFVILAFARLLSYRFHHPWHGEPPPRRPRASARRRAGRRDPAGIYDYYDVP
jgi:uncharacterized membrane protein YeaQ/YmgE (transglycosylase-associated protein family)